MDGKCEVSSWCFRPRLYREQFHKTINYFSCSMKSRQNVAPTITNRIESQSTNEPLSNATQHYRRNVAGFMHNWVRSSSVKRNFQALKRLLFRFCPPKLRGNLIRNDLCRKKRDNSNNYFHALWRDKRMDAVRVARIPQWMRQSGWKNWVKLEKEK